MSTPARLNLPSVPNDNSEMGRYVQELDKALFAYSQELYEYLEGAVGTSYIATFQNAATVPAVGTTLPVGEYDTLVIEITGTSASRTIQFECAGESGVFEPMVGIKVATLASGTSTTGSAEKWQFNVTALTSVRMNLTAVAGGNVTIKGKVA